MTDRLHPDDIAAIARAVAVELRGAPGARGGLVDASTVAKALGVTRQTIYAHSDALGGRRVGAGARPRLRFDLDEAVEAWTARPADEQSEAREAAPRQRSRRAAPRVTASGAPLLPIRGEGS